MTDFSIKLPGDAEIFTFDYTADLASGETITGAAWSVQVVSGTDAGAASMVSGSASVNGAKVSQMIVGGVAGVYYRLLCAATTSLGQTITKYAHVKVDNAA
jgi:hypothetical protein